MIALRATLAFGALLLCLPGHALARMVGPRPSPWIRRFLALVADIFGLDTHVDGTPVAGNVLYVANHVSWLDILAIGGTTGTAFVSKDDVAGWPVIGWLAREGGTVFVSRSSRTAVRKQADALGEALANGRAVTLFPEGTTGDGTELRPFLGALFVSVENAPPGLMVQPIAIDYGARAPWLAWHDNEPVGHNARRILTSRRKISVRLRFLDPIDPTVVIGRKAIASLSRERIAAALSESGTIPYRAAP